MNTKFLSAFVSLLLTAQSYAGYDNDDIYNAQLSFGWAPVVTITAGPTWAEAGENQRVFYPDSSGVVYFSDYYAHKSYNLGASGNVFFALQKLVYPGIIAQFGLEAGGTSSFDLRGTIAPQGVLNSYDYYYKFSHAEIGLEAKFIAANPGFIQPYVSASAGVGFNHAHAFSYIPVINPPVFYTPWYQKGTVTGAFTYSLGAGVQTNFYRYWQFGIGYQFADLGKSDLGPAVNNPYFTDDVGLHTTHAYAHQLQFSLGYLWDSMP